MKRVIVSNFPETIQVIEEVLTDHSKVYNIRVDLDEEIPCATLEEALEVYDNFMKLFYDREGDK